MDIGNILNESLIDYEKLDLFLEKYDLTPEQKVAVYEFHAKAYKKNKTLVISETKKINLNLFRRCWIRAFIPKKFKNFN